MGVANFGFPTDRAAAERDRRLREVWDWVVAIDAFDHGAPGQLEDLVRGNAEIPDELRPALADIIAGRRRPNRKAAGKLKVPAEERLKIAAAVSAVHGLIDALKANQLDADIEWAAERRRVEPAAVLREIETHRKAYMAGVASDLGVSVETIENLLRDLRKKVASWPRV
jgi:hypothetical protein